MNRKLFLLLNLRCVAHFSAWFFAETANMFSLQKKVMVLVLVTFPGFISCNEPADTPAATKDSSADSSFFYPVKEFFETQLSKTDTLQNMQCIQILDGKDTTREIITSAKLRQLAQPFLISDISTPSVKQFYKESVFHDASTVSNTFTYTSTKEILPVQSMDILLDTATDLVKHVFILKNYKKSDTTILEKLSWKTGEVFTITQLLQPANGKETTRQTIVSWKANY